MIPEVAYEHDCEVELEIKEGSQTPNVEISRRIQHPNILAMSLINVFK